MVKFSTRLLHRLLRRVFPLCFIAIVSIVIPGSLASSLRSSDDMAASGSSDKASVEHTKYKGWNVYRLTNGLVSLIIAPEISGRAIQLFLGDQEYFFVNSDLAGKVIPPEQNNMQTGWANYGGDKVWPAPEGWMNDNQWPAIPYYVLDGSPFDSTVVKESPGEVAVRVVSPSDPRTGIQFTRIFHVYAGTSRIRVDQTMHNTSRRQIRWGIWHVMQHDAADIRDPNKPNPSLFMYVPLNAHSLFPEGYSAAYGDVRHPAYEVINEGRMLRIHYLYRVSKVNIDSNAGWYAMVNGQKNIGFIETFKTFPGQEYPDNASIAAWLNGPGTITRRPYDQTLADDPKKTAYVFESEVLSPYATLDPGEEYTFTVYWLATRVPNPVVDSQWAGVVSTPFSAVLRGNQVQLQGVFGVFTPGTAEAVFYSVKSEELSHLQLRPVDPRQTLNLDESVLVPHDAFRVSLRIVDSDGGNRGYLGNAILK